MSEMTHQKVCYLECVMTGVIISPGCMEFYPNLHPYYCGFFFVIALNKRFYFKLHQLLEMSYELRLKPCKYNISKTPVPLACMIVGFPLF